MRASTLWLLWLVLPVFGLAYHFGPGQVWLARDQAAVVIQQAQAHATDADEAQAVAYQSHLQLLKARREAFLADVDDQTQPKHPLAVAVRSAGERQTAAYEDAAEKWNTTAELYGQATDTLIDAIHRGPEKDVIFEDADRQLLESLRWAQARAMVRGGLVFIGIDQLQALLELRMADAQQQTTANRITSVAVDGTVALPTEAIREELAAAQYVGARLLREEGRPPEVWRPVANEARQHYRFLADHADAVIDLADESPTARSDMPALSNKTESTESMDLASDAAELNHSQRVQRNLEQVLNLEQSSSEQLEGIPLPRRAPMARRPGDGEPGERPGKRPGLGPLQDGPSSTGAGIPGPYGTGW